MQLCSLFKAYFKDKITKLSIRYDHINSLLPGRNQNIKFLFQSASAQLCSSITADAGLLCLNSRLRTSHGGMVGSWMEHFIVEYTLYTRPGSTNDLMMPWFFSLHIVGQFYSSHIQRTKFWNDYYYLLIHPTLGKSVEYFHMLNCQCEKRQLANLSPARNLADSVYSIVECSLDHVIMIRDLFLPGIKKHGEIHYAVTWLVHYPQFAGEEQTFLIYCFP